VQRYAVLAGLRDLGLHLPRPVDRSGAQLGEPEPAALVETERVHVVVRGGEPYLAAAVAARRADRGLDEQRSDPGAAVDGVEGDDLEHVADDLVGQQPGNPA
jgi:hypothetical protein